MSVLKIKTIVPAVIASLMFVLLATPSISAAPIDNGAPAATSVTPTTAQIRDTIKAKCDTAFNNKDFKKAHSKESGYTLFSAACKGTGGYEEGATKKAQRAKRLIDICNDHKQYLQEAGAYKAKGSILSGDCDAIGTSDGLVALTRNLKEYPKGTLGNAQDPALNCKPNQSSNEASTSTKCDLVKKYIDPFITFLSALVAIGVIIGIISGGIRYTTAGDDTQKVAAARNQIRGALVALIAYIFLYAFIQWALP